MMTTTTISRPLRRAAVAAAVMYALLLAASCTPSENNAQVMARHVPERMDDFVWENDLICYRIYGKALEGNPTSPGLDLWVKTPGGLVADQRYKDELENGRTYHKDWGNGKDCYKVGVSLGAGASVPVVDGRFVYPATNYRSFEIVSRSPKKIVFSLSYPEWEVDGHMVSLTRTITVEAGSYFCLSEDRYDGDFDNMTVAAGICNHEVSEYYERDDRFAIWEKASDTSIEPEDGMIGVAIIMDGDGPVEKIGGDQSHMVATRTVHPGESVRYKFGSCWSKGDINNAGDWFYLVGNTEL